MKTSLVDDASSMTRRRRARRPGVIRDDCASSAQDGAADSLGITLSEGAPVSIGAMLSVPGDEPVLEPEQATRAAAMATITMSRLSIWSPPGITASGWATPGGRL
jgi:hypothetical protein